MAHFRTKIKGNRGWVYRTGTMDSGMVAHIHGRHFGVRVELQHDHQSGQDIAYVYRTGGASTNEDEEEFLFVVTPTEILE